MVGLSACGDDRDGGAEAGGSSDASSEAPGTEESPRAVEIDMVDNAFEPAEVEVAAGETVRFVFRNTGAVVHDAVIGDEATQDDHIA
jgi:plastocyanin